MCPSRSRPTLAAITVRILIGICMRICCVATKVTPSNTFQQWTEGTFNRGHKKLRQPLSRRTTGIARILELENKAWENLSKEEKKDILKQQKDSKKNDEEGDAGDQIETVSGGVEASQEERLDSKPKKKKQKKKNQKEEKEEGKNLNVVACICDDDRGNERRELREYATLAHEEWYEDDWINRDIIGSEVGLPSALRSLGLFDSQGVNVTSPKELVLHRQNQKGANENQKGAIGYHGKSGKGSKHKNSKAHKLKKGASKMGGKSSKSTKPCKCSPIERTRRPTNKPIKPSSIKPSRKPAGEKPYTRRPTKKPNETTRPVAEKPKTRSPTERPSRPTRKPIKTPKPFKTRRPTLKPIKTRKPSMKTKKPSKTQRPTKKPIRAPKPVKTKRPTSKPIKTTKPTMKPTRTKNPSKTQRPTRERTKTPKPVKTRRPTLKPIKTRKPTMKPTRTKKPTQNPTTNNISPQAPTNKPTVPPTLSPTKAPTLKPTTQPTKAPSKAPTRMPTSALSYSVDVCYPGCGNFTAIYTQNQFQSLILKYVPCSSSLCTVDITFQSGTCTTCSIDSSQRSRLLQVNPFFRSSTIAFTIESKAVLDNQAVTSNINSNKTNMNSDLKATNSTFRINSNFTQVSQSPTRTPSKAPSRKPTPQPTKAPTKIPTLQPTKAPVEAGPTNPPTKAPTKKPTLQPTKAAVTVDPTNAPTKTPTKKPTLQPTKAPVTASPANAPTKAPTKKPILQPTTTPAKAGPTNAPTKVPTMNPLGETNKPTTSAPVGGQQLAVYDSELKVPRCIEYGSECSSGALLKGRGNVQNGTELNQPNSLDKCDDGDSGSYPANGFIEKIAVKSGDVNGVGSGVDMTEGNNAAITATVIAVTDWSRYFADFYYARKTESIPDWKFIGSIQHPGRGQQVLMMNYTIPSGDTYQAVRVNFRNQGSSSPCSSGDYDDVDDLVFKVKLVTSPVFPQMAVFDSELKVPRCIEYGSECSSGALLQGRGNVQNGTEQNQPNSLDKCDDGDSGSYPANG
ncbi:hypothetical protein ACHAWX_002913, partial [Stephanocyclus meneghinianus]